MYIPVADVESMMRGIGFAPAAETMRAPAAVVVVPTARRPEPAVVETNTEPVAVILVELAYGRTEGTVVDVAVKYEPMMLLPRMSPATESFWPGDVVPIPTFPFASTSTTEVVATPAVVGV